MKLLRIFNHEPGARASRNARLGRLLPSLGTKPAALARAIGIRPTPAPRGYARVHVTKTRVPRDTKTFKPHVDARKAFGAFSNAQFALWESVSMLPVWHLRGRGLCEAFSCSRRLSDKFSCRPKGVFVTDATTQPRRDGVDADAADARRSLRLQTSRRLRTRQSRNARCRRARFVVKNGSLIFNP